MMLIEMNRNRWLPAHLSPSAGALLRLLCDAAGEVSSSWHMERSVLKRAGRVSSWVQGFVLSGIAFPSPKSHAKKQACA